MTKAITALTLASLLFSGAIFGFFYAWVCSTMWGLDAADPRIAIQAMQAMNASVRNITFAPAFFGTPIVLVLTAGVLWAADQRKAAGFFGLGAVIYFVFGLILTMKVNVPMNEALGLVIVPTDSEAARILWQDYSHPWQFWNQMRTIASGLSLACVGYGTLLCMRNA